MRFIYTYHWQEKNGTLIRRWDNAPYHDNETFPHHVHIKNKVEASYNTNIKEVLLKIEELLTSQTKPSK